MREAGSFDALFAQFNKLRSGNPMLSIRFCEAAAFRVDMKTRFPFGYGIASMTEVPHLFLRAQVEIDGRVTTGLSAEGLPPKWFTKNPETTFEEDDLPEMLLSIRQAVQSSLDIGPHPSFFRWWLELVHRQQDWAKANGRAPLLASLGSSLAERAALDALCRSSCTPLFQAARQNLLGINFAAIRPELGDIEPQDIMPQAPSNSVFVRHTVGLTDPITSADADQTERPADSLPFTLEENIRTYGLSYFKLKLSGRPEHDRQRLLHIASVMDKSVQGEAKFTLDGNENFASLADFRTAWEAFAESPVLRKFFERSLLFVEQPIHRATALSSGVAEQLQRWPDSPPMIIDESDAELSSLPTALALGYSGTSHKNCKGIIKGLVAKATLFMRAQETPIAPRPHRPSILSAEDLGNVGPVALLQDLAAVAMLGIGHVERNGHHYFAGLSMFDESLQRQMLDQHSDLYSKTSGGFAAVDIHQGQLSLGSVNGAPFGLEPKINVDQYANWNF